MTGAFSWISTWVVTIILLAILAQTSWGRGIVYYLLWLSVVLVLVSHADELTSMINLQALNLNG